MVEVVMITLYSLWLIAGCADFRFHRQTDLPHTSGLRESLLHGLQLMLIGGGVVAWLSLSTTVGLVLGLAIIVVMHAVAGYLDTLSADGRRRISPAEQHVHSVLDAAPWIFLAWLGVNAEPGWELRREIAEPMAWALMLVPAVVLVLLPWAYEFERSVRARSGTSPRS